MKEYRVKVLGLDCPNCTAKLERALANSKLLQNVSLSFVTKTLVYSLNNEEDYNSSIDEIKRIINKVEPDAYLDQGNSNNDEHEHHHEGECCHEHHHEHHHEGECCHEHHHEHHHERSCCHEHHNHSHNHHEGNKKTDIILMSISILLLVIGIILENINLSFNTNIICIILFILSYLLISYDILIKSFKNIIRGQIFDENFLMAIASIGAMFLREFHEAVLVIFLYKLGEMFQDYAINNSHRSIKNLLEMQPKFANLVVGENIKTVNPNEVKVNDIIVIKVGERVPLDGEIIEGSSSFDTSSINGESKPMDLEVGNEISSGYINLSSLVKVKVLKKYVDSNVSKILKMIEESQDKKSNNEKFISKFAKYYTPIVVILALLLVLIPSLLHVIIPDVVTSTFKDWLYKGLVFLVVSCPCALVISIPLTFFSGIGRCSKSGILVKGSNYLEKMSKVDTIVFDKTGTITKGNFKISKIISNKVNEEEVLKYAYICDYYSNHPIALAIKEKAKDIEVNIALIEDSITLGGLGIKTIYDNKEILVGNEKLMKENNIEYIKENEIGTIIYVSIDNKFIGSIIIKDEIKENIQSVVESFHSKNINTYMLSGDNYEVCNEVASLVKIKKFKASLFPLDKVEELKNIIANKKDNYNVVFIGDGVNDAPSLVNADVGISMGGLGSDVAIESSDIVISDDSIERVDELIKISKFTNKIVKQNIVFSIGIKMIVMILTVFGLSTMLLGIFADVGVMILAVLNSLRVLTIKK